MCLSRKCEHDLQILPRWSNQVVKSTFGYHGTLTYLARPLISLARKTAAESNRSRCKHIREEKRNRGRSTSDVLEPSAEILSHQTITVTLAIVKLHWRLQWHLPLATGRPDCRVSHRGVCSCSTPSGLEPQEPLNFSITLTWTVYIKVTPSKQYQESSDD